MKNVDKLNGEKKSVIFINKCPSISFFKNPIVLEFRPQKTNWPRLNWGPEFERGESEEPTHCRLPFLLTNHKREIFSQRTPAFNDLSRHQSKGSDWIAYLGLCETLQNAPK